MPPVTFKKIDKSNFQLIWNMFSIIKFDPIMAKNRAIKMVDEKIIINSIIEDSTTSFLENPKILNTKF
jgi:hypothetical protein